MPIAGEEPSQDFMADSEPPCTQCRGRAQSDEVHVALCRLESPPCPFERSASDILLSFSRPLLQLHPRHTDCSDVSGVRKQRKRSNSLLGTEEMMSAPGTAVYLERAFVDEVVVAERHRSTSDMDDFPWPRVALWTAFGASGWWGFNGITAQLPLLIADLPEKEQLGAQLGLLCQLGISGLLLYKSCRCLQQLRVELVIGATIAMQLLNLIVCTFSWDRSFSGHSLPLFFCSLFAGGVGCLSGSTYYALVSKYPVICMKYMGLGGSLGGIVVQGFAYLQMGFHRSQPACSVTAFFFAVACFQLLCMGALFFILRGQDAAESEDGFSDPDSPKKSLGSNEESQDSLVELELPSSSRPVKICYVCIFVIQGINYALPALIPYLALVSGTTNKRTVLLRIGNCQQWGETIGRLLAPYQMGAWSNFCTLAASMYMILSLSYFLLLALHPQELTFGLQDDMVELLIPFLIFTYVCAYGMAISGIRVYARSLLPEEDNSERMRVQSNMGLWAQMGSLTSNLIAFTCVTLAV